jgi:hypothetical protein
VTSRFAETLDAKETSSAALRRIEDRARDSVRVAFGDLSGKFTGLLGLVVKNNPGKTPEEILGREDIAELLTKTLETGLSRARRSIQSAHVSAGGLGSVSAAQDLARLGIVAPRVPTPGTDYLNSVLADLERNVSSVVSKASDAIRDVWDLPLPPSYHQAVGGAANPLKEQAAIRSQAIKHEVERIARDLTLRSELGVASVAHRAFTDAQTMVFKAAAEANPGVAILKVWVADTKSERPPCALCNALHGLAIPLDEEFPHGNADVYGDLQGPPRHPNCRCRIVPHLVTLDEPEPEVPKLPEAARTMTAVEVQRMPQSRLRAILAALLALIHKLGG